MAERKNRGAELSALATATEGLRPTDALTDSLMARLAEAPSGEAVREEASPELCRLARATEGLDARADFVDATLALVLAEARDASAEEPWQRLTK